MSSLTTACLIALLVVGAHSAFIIKRSADEGEKECPGRQPCGWMVYNKLSRNMEFFMNNTCVCAQDRQCVQTDDDLSVGAYVYRCLARKDSSLSLIPS